jgi:hypothetical protein
MTYSPKTKERLIAPLLLAMFLVSPVTAVAEEAKTVSEERATFPVAAERTPIRTLNVFATAYSSDPNQTDDTPCIPAMGSFDLCEAYLEHGMEDTIAANFLRLGTKVRFPELYGDKIFTVRDRMNSRYNYDRLGYYRIDFYKAEADAKGSMDNKASKREAIEFGFKKNIKMEVLGV